MLPSMMWGFPGAGGVLGGRGAQELVLSTFSPPSVGVEGLVEIHVARGSAVGDFAELCNVAPFGHGNDLDLTFGMVFVRNFFTNLQIL